MGVVLSKLPELSHPLHNSHSSCRLRWNAFSNAHFLQPTSPYLDSHLLAYLHDWPLTKVTRHMGSCMAYTPYRALYPSCPSTYHQHNITYDMALATYAPSRNTNGQQSFGGLATPLESIFPGFMTPAHIGPVVYYHKLRVGSRVRK